MQQFVRRGRSYFSPEKTEERVRFTMAMTKLIAILVLAILAAAFAKFCRMVFIRWRGINPSAYCITDSAHLFLSSSHLTLMQIPFVRNMLQILSSLMIDCAFCYYAITWYLNGLTQVYWRRCEVNATIIRYSFLLWRESFHSIHLHLQDATWRILAKPRNPFLDGSIWRFFRFLLQWAHWLLRSTYQGNLN